MQFDLSTLFLVDKKEGFSPAMSHLVSMMNYTRDTTLRSVQDVTFEELDFLMHDEANSIGMLLGHMAAVEKVYQILTFENREPTMEEIEELSPGLDLGKKGREFFIGKSLESYIEELEEIRGVTYQKFRSLPEQWLFEKTPFWMDQQGNNYFKWFHVFEDEINHRGQIRLIKKYCRVTQLQK
ncbi:DinB family protein [Mesobacillus foraminis]|uniref:Uncharacterized protein DUF664 n=1 Tax=Mesobacillus foraminis TaxID=279826 RepID=A0A4R2BKQ3_9BACI|nr:DinB family protein [Mesobacillus foraminis]TCN27245.1 uncharacterized protein DUF664 [Mesobacillus foraminis]